MKRKRRKMANKRMFTMKIVDSDAFLDMPLSARCLYYDLCMRADDDGFIGNPKRIARMIGASEDDLKFLIAKRFVLTFENGVIVIKHWRMHNTISSGRYHETQYLEEKSTLRLKQNKSYSLDSGVPIDDSKLLEMYSENKRRTIGEQLENNWRTNGEQLENNWRTNGEQLENSDIDIDIDKDKDIGLELDIDKDKDLGLELDIDKDKDIGLELDIDKDKDLGLNINNNIAQSYTAKPIASEQLADIEALILNTGEEWRPKESDFEEYTRLYPGVDVPQEFRKMRAWCINNPKKRKTVKGIKRFVGNWLNSAQDEVTKNRTARSNNGNSYIDAVKNRVSEVDDWV